MISSPPTTGSGNTRSFGRDWIRMVLQEHGYEVFNPNELDLSNYICATNVKTGRQIAVSHSGFAHPGPFIKPNDPNERSTVHGHEKKAVADFDICLSKYPEIEGFAGFTSSYGGNYKRTMVMIAPLEGIREVASPGKQFTLGRHTKDKMKWDFRQSAPTVPGSMLATITIDISSGPVRKGM